MVRNDLRAGGGGGGLRGGGEAPPPNRCWGVGRLKQPTFSIVTNDDSMEPQSPEQSSMMRQTKKQV